MKYLSYEGLQYLYGKILTRLGLKVDATNGDISGTKISTFDTLSTEFPVPVAGENTKTVLGKIKKFITDFNSLKSSLLLLGMLTSQYENNTAKIPTAALVYALKQSLDATNSNLTIKTARAASWAANVIVSDCKKYGKICFCSVYAYKSSGTLTADESLFSVPWNPAISANDAVMAGVGRNTASGASGPISIRLSHTYNTVTPNINYPEYNEIRCTIVYLEE